MIKAFFKSHNDKFFLLMLLPISFVIIGLLIIILSLISSKAAEALKVYGPYLYIASVWDPENELYGIFPPIVGTLVTSAIAVTIALLFAFSLTILMSEYLSGLLRVMMSTIVEFMSGLPTVIYALWGTQYVSIVLRDYLMIPLNTYLGFIPLFSCRPISGYSILTAGVVIGLSLIPYITALINEAYSLIPITYKEACLGIGATKYESIKILMGLCKPAIIAAVLLGFARAMGETTIAAALVGNSMNVSACIFNPGYTVAALIASQYANAQLYSYAEVVLYAAALVVMALALILGLVGLNLMLRWRVKVIA